MQVTLTHPEWVYFAIMTSSLYIMPLITWLLTKEIYNLTQNIDIKFLLVEK